MAASQRRRSPAGKSLTSWAVVATEDKASGHRPRAVNGRAPEATRVEIAGAPAIIVSQPETVTNVILKALDAVG